MPPLNPTFCRRLLLCHLISTLERPSVPQLMDHTGWPRRTIQDILKALPGLGVELHFQQDGRRHNDGYYVLGDWGALNAEWVRRELDSIRDTLCQGDAVTDG